MSGGHFDYQQQFCYYLADSIEELITNNDSNEVDEWGDPIGYHYPPEIIKRFQKAVDTLRRAGNMGQRIDWLVSSDDGEETFLKRWKEEGLDK